MDNKEIQAQFIKWLANKTGAKSEQELTDIIKKLQSTEGAMEQTIQEFKKELGESQSESMFKKGGKLDYLDCLSKFKKGGKMDCGCGSKSPKIQKAFLGSVLGALKGASTIMKGGTSAIKGAQTLATIGKVANTAQGMLNIGKNIVGGTNPVGLPSANNIQNPSMEPLEDTSTSSPLTTLGVRKTQSLKPMNTPKQSGLKPMIPIATPKLV